MGILSSLEPGVAILHIGIDTYPRSFRPVVTHVLLAACTLILWQSGNLENSNHKAPSTFQQFWSRFNKTILMNIYSATGRYKEGRKEENSTFDKEKKKNPLWVIVVHCNLACVAIAYVFFFYLLKKISHKKVKLPFKGSTNVSVLVEMRTKVRKCYNSLSIKTENTQRDRWTNFQLWWWECSIYGVCVSFRRKRRDFDVQISKQWILAQI